MNEFLPALSFLMLTIDSLRYSYPPLVLGQPRTIVLDGVSLRVEPGQCLAVIGANDSGKSTLCLAAAGLAPRLTQGRIDQGIVQVASRDVQSEPPGALAGVLGLLMQDPAGQLFNPTIAQEIAWGLENLGVPPADMDARVVSALAMVGLSHLPLDRSPASLSGGEQKRLALASVLALSPRLLILDEPSGGLAPAARAEMIQVLQRLRSDTGLSLLLVETDPEVIIALADEIALLAEGRIVQRAAPRYFYLSLDQAAFPAVTIPPALLFAHSLEAGGGLSLAPLTAAEAADLLPKPECANLPSANPEKKRIPPHDPAVELDRVTFAYDSTRPVLRDLSLQIARGEFIALTGDNGAGKTTLARHLIGLLRPTSGIVRILGADAAPQSIGRLAQRVGLAFQNPELQIFNATVRAEIAYGPRNLGLHGAALDSAVKSALDRFELCGVADHPPAALSFSARRMVALAAIAAMQTPILVLDEPTVGLDAAHTSRVVDWLEERCASGVTILLITHNMELAAACADRVLVLEAGQIAADGSPHEVFSQPDVLHRAGLYPPFAVELARRLGQPIPPSELTPQGAARAWLRAAR